MIRIVTTITIAITFIWVGLLCGVSFLEAPLKFQAPGITLELGLGIGKLVFGALTKIEMAIALLIIAGLIVYRPPFKYWFGYVLPILIVAIDNVMLMPILDTRIDMITSGHTPPESSAHWWYVVLELVKLIALIVVGYKYMRHHLCVSAPLPT